MNFIIGDATKVVTVENTADGAKVFEKFHGDVSKTVPRYQFLERDREGKSNGNDAAAVKRIFRTRPVLKNLLA